MKKLIKPSRASWSQLIDRPYNQEETIRFRVQEVLQDVKKNGQKALNKYSLAFDGLDLEKYAMAIEINEKGFEVFTDSLRSAIRRAAANIELFHRNQLQSIPPVKIAEGVECWQKDVPIECVGFYIPGGSAPLFSTVLMLGIPAAIAGCKEMVLCTPADKVGEVPVAIRYAASLCGIKKIFALGGAQAIGAMAYGVGPIPKVNKIYGPGNQYVTLAKQLVSEDGVAIDMPAGPSEVLVITDQKCDPRCIAADLLSQAEHGPDSQVVLLGTDEAMLDRVQVELNKQLDVLPRKEIAKKALEGSFMVLLDSLEEAMEFSNLYAPEHLIISTENARDMAEQVCNAGSVFIGNYTPESAGDYASGTNHTLPTNGFARSFSGLNLGSFMKTIQFQEIKREGLLDLGPAIIEMAESEGLSGHAEAVRVRIKNKSADEI